MYNVIDLFAGAGGLSLGFVQTGKYEIKVAFENNPAMQETYRRNHPNVEVRGDVRDTDYKKIIEEYGDIDIVIGGPPCQGFSNANRQKNHAISQNNMLVKEYIRAILDLQPKAFVMENVSMLRSDVHRFFLTESDINLINYLGIELKNTPIELLDEDAFFSEAETIVKNPNLINKYLWPENHFTVINVIYKYASNNKKFEKALTKYKKQLIIFSQEHISETDDYIFIQDRKAFSSILDYYNGMMDSSSVKNQISAAVKIQKMLNKAKEIHDNNLHVDGYSSEKGLSANIRSYAVFDYVKKQLEASGYVINAKVVCAADYGAPQKRMRFVVMGIRKELADNVDFPKGEYITKYNTVHDAISDLENIDPVYDLQDDANGILLSAPNEKLSDLALILRDSSILKNHITTKTTDVAMARFKAIAEGQNFHSLSEEMKTNTYSDAKRTQNTIYLRLKYSEPCGTVVNVRKSMWIHPKKDRAISVREAARLQTFPDSFIFYGNKDKQYQQVGNAVPPIMAKAIAESLYSQLNNDGTNN